MTGDDLKPITVFRNWEPINEEAKDGADVLLFSPDATEPQVFIGFWAEWEPIGDSRTEPNWVDSWTHRDIDTEPTHWMPLPSVPA